jgi:hypothetical protein
MGRSNPYAPTKASLAAAEVKHQTGGVWRDGKHVLVAHGASFPQRCVKCNAEVGGQSKVRKVHWHHPSIYLLLLVYVIVYVVVAAIMRKTAQIDPCLCDEHARKRRRWIWTGWLGALFGLIGVPVLGAMMEAEMIGAIVIGICCFLLFAIAGSTNARILYPSRIDANYARLKGADPRFLAGLPKFL